MLQKTAFYKAKMIGRIGAYQPGASFIHAGLNCTCDTAYYSLQIQNKYRYTGYNIDGWIRHFCQGLLRYFYYQS